MLNVEQNLVLILYVKVIPFSSMEYSPFCGYSSLEVIAKPSP